MRPLASTALAQSDSLQRANYPREPIRNVDPTAELYKCTGDELCTACHVIRRGQVQLPSEISFKTRSFEIFN